jgi:hypothetical protein
MHQLREYIYVYPDQRKTKVGVIIAHKISDTKVVIVWSKYNYYKEAKPFDEYIMSEILHKRFELMVEGHDRNKKIPVNMQTQMDRFKQRCSRYFKNCSIDVYGTYADKTPSRVKRELVCDYIE